LKPERTKGDNMKKKLHHLAVASVLSLMSLAPATHAESLRLRANIPFDFAVSNEKLPAGEYNLKFLAQDVILVQNEGTKQSAIALGQYAQSVQNPERGKLIFKKYGDQYFLSQVWAGFSEAGQQLPASSLERQVASGAASRQMASHRDKSGNMEGSKN
jgi:hypothetical protein